MSTDFDEVIVTRERLRQVLEEPDSTNVTHKGSDNINALAKRFIQASPFVVIATIGKDGLLDVSPKGDPAGFVEVFDEQTLVIPDRLGNHRLDTFENILVNPAVGLIFIVPGNTETLRVAGKARIVLDKAIQERHAVNGKRPVLAMVVKVEQAFMHCSKSFVRARMWKSEMWPNRTNVPTLAEWVKSTVQPPDTVEALQAIHDNDASTRLY
jgi:PPOX class probable FMN-dependent enzyme